MKNLFVGIFSFFETKKAILYSLFFALLFIFTWLASQLEISNDLQSMLPKQKNEKDITSILTHNKALDKIIFSISTTTTESINPDLLIQYAETFAEEIKKQDRLHLIKEIQLKQDEEQIGQMIETVYQNLPFLLEEKDYQLIQQKLNVDSISKILDNNLTSLYSPAGMMLKSFMERDPLGITYLAFQKLNALQQDENTQLYDGYIIAKDESYLTFFITAAFPSTNSKKNEALTDLIANSKKLLSQNPEFKSIQCEYFGGQLVSGGNSRQMRMDTYLTLSITLVLLLTLFFSFFKQWWTPFQVLIPVLFGGLFSMAMMFLIKGEVSAIALGASCVILGIAVNYSLHFLSHYRDSGDKKHTIFSLAEPMTIGGFTTIAAFLSLTLVNAPVLQQLGLFAAFSLIGSSLCTLIFLPHFIGQQTPIKKINWLDKLARYEPNKNKWLLLGILLAIGILSFFIPKVSFNEDLMTMNYMSEELQHAQKIINQRNAASLNTLFYINEGKDLESALNANINSVSKFDQLKAKGLIHKYAGIGQFLLSENAITEKLNRWNAFWTKNKPAETIAQLSAIGSQKGYSTHSFHPFHEMISRPYHRPDTNYTRLFKKFFSDFIIEKDGNTQIMSMIKTTQGNRNRIYESCKGMENGYLTDRQMITSQFANGIKSDFYNIFLYSSCIVFLTILLSYGRIELALISFIPMFLTWLCILGLMGLLNIQFNIINVIISTLIFGLGDDYSIFITDGLLEKYKYGNHKIQTTKTSIYLSALTTIIGLGILLIAKHPALKSIAVVSVIGILSILLVSQTIQPLLFNFFIQNRTNKKQHPFTLWSFTKTIFAFIYYVVGCMLVTLVGFILVKCIPFAKEKMKYAYHVVICKMMWSLLYIMGNVKKSFYNKHEEDFSKPSVLIANHTSFLDLLRIISLHPKILLMTNKWVWRSPVFGALVRLADYYPVEEGAEFSIDKLKYWVDKGYSIAVFPEGTRSYTDQIARFKKGAFYLAEKLNLDIRPVLFHGVGYSMSKGDFLLKNGEINVKFLPRITPNDTRFGNNYSERAKNIGRYFREAFEQYKQEREIPKYHFEKLLHNYKYKGPVLEWYAFIKIKLENYYAPIEKWVPRKGQILDLGCGYGFLDYMLSFTSEHRNITGIDYDHEKINVANHNFSKNEQLNFISSDISTYNFTVKYDCILILDVLHYLPIQDQQNVMKKCYHSLSENGILIIREGMKDISKSHQGTVLTEIMSTQIFKFNKTKTPLYFPSTDEFKTFAKDFNLNMNIVNEPGITSNLLCVFTKKENK